MIQRVPAVQLGTMVYHTVQQTELTTYNTQLQQNRL